MAALTPPIAGKLGRFIRLLGSDRDGEVIAAARALIRVLNTAGTDLHALADHVEQSNGDGKLSEKEMKKLYDAGFRPVSAPVKLAATAMTISTMPMGRRRGTKSRQFCQQQQDRLSTREQEFINSVLEPCIASQLKGRRSGLKQSSCV